MGLLALLRKLKRNDREARILMLGLDCAGKTTVLKTLSEESVKEIMPTQGFNVKTLTHDGFKLNVWDIGGQRAIRQHWRDYYEQTDGLVFVIDSADGKRVEEAALELRQLVEEPKMDGVPLLILANKQDLITALPPAEIAEGLQLQGVRNHQWQIQACSAKQGQGLQEGLEWLIRALDDKASRSSARPSMSSSSSSGGGGGADSSRKEEVEVSGATAAAHSSGAEC